MKNCLFKYTKSCIFILTILSLSPVSFGQGLGFSVHAGTFPSVAGVSLVFNGKVLSDLKIEGKFGFVAGDEDYTGLEGIVNILYYPVYPVYLIGGFSNHWNAGSAHSSHQSATGAFMFADLGVGADINEVVSMEVVYCIALDKYYYSSEWNYSTQGPASASLKNVIRADFKFHWDMW